LCPFNEKVFVDLHRNFYHALDYFSLQNLPLLFKLKALVKHYDNIGHYFQDPHLKAAFTFQNMYLGLSPFDAPATYSLLQYSAEAFLSGDVYQTDDVIEVAFQRGRPLFVLAREWLEQPGLAARPTT
jgi:hypothetical protein